MIRIDGTEGEGGGQILRTALGLSVVTGMPVQLEQIRAGRRKPGLQRQHLTAVQAAARVGCAALSGAAIGSQAITFEPGGCQPGRYEFAIGTAGSTTLVLQTILPALWSAGGLSEVRLTGGTHNPLAPTADFLERSFAGVIGQMGAGLGIDLKRHGFFPAGGGELVATVQPASWRKIDLLDAHAESEVRVRILHSALPAGVPDREAKVLAKRLELEQDRIEIREVPSNGPGNVVLCLVERGGVCEVVSAFGERRVTAESVASRAAKEVLALRAAGVQVGEHLADQLLIPMALAGGGAFRTVEPSLHSRTNAAVIERFLPVAISFREDSGAGNWVVEVAGR